MAWQHHAMRMRFSALVTFVNLLHHLTRPDSERTRASESRARCSNPFLCSPSWLLAATRSQQTYSPMCHERAAKHSETVTTAMMTRRDCCDNTAHPRPERRASRQRTTNPNLLMRFSFLKQRVG